MSFFTRNRRSLADCRAPRLSQVCIGALWIAVAAAARAQIPAFPGAEGYGAYAIGGRNGDVYHVTNLNASGAGSFANGIATVPPAGRTIVFDVSGYIRLPSGSGGTRLTSSKVTIAGQTAPGDGIGFYNNFFRISGDDVIIRHTRFRHGKYGSGGDCVDLDSGCLNAILDHVSMQFSTDENMSSFGSPPENVTLQYSLNAWGLETHSCGGLWDQNHATSHHNLWAHNHTRNPKARPSGLLEWVNNVTFDWDIGFIMGDSTSVQSWKANVINNYFICPPGNTQSKALVKGTVATNGRPNFTIFLGGNLTDNNGDALLNGTDKGYGIVEGTPYTDAEGLATAGTFRYYQAPSAISGSVKGVATDPAVTAYKKIVSAAGALRLEAGYARGLRDEVDTILIAKLTSRERGHVTRESDTGASASGFGTLVSGAAPTDTDQDGMPDYYETALGWNVAADDHTTSLASSGGVITGTTFFPVNTPSGYTRLEEYLHFLAIPHGTVAKNVSGSPTSLAIDLRKFTSGFSSAPTFTVSNVANGSVAQSGTGNSIATFTPTLNYTGRARFDFTVTDADGSTWTQTCGIVVVNNALPRDLVWKGDGTANAWDGLSSNWLRNGAVTAFSNGDSATFDDSGSIVPGVNVTGIVAGGVVVNATSNYSFTGGGYLLSPLTKRGPGALTIGNTGTNSLNPTRLEEGTLIIPNTGIGLGGGALTMTGGTLQVSSASTASPITLAGNATIVATTSHSLNGSLGGSGTLAIGNSGNNTLTVAGNLSNFGGTLALGASSGFLRLNSSSTSFTGSAAATFDLGTGTATLQNRNGNLTIDLGALRGGPSTTLSGAGSTANPTTYSIGANGADTTFAGTIANGSGTTAITKTGPGTLTLAGASTYTGATNVNAGWLLVGGALGNTPVTVASGAFLGGSGIIGGSLTANAGATLSPGTAPFTGATLTVNGGVALNGNTLYFDMSSSPTGANDKIVMNGGTLALSGTQYFQFLLLDGVLGAGTYDLVAGATNSTASNVNLTHNLPTGTRQTFALSRPPAGSNPSYIRLTVTGNPATLTWTGAANTNWDTTSANWTGAAPSTFFANDAVIFDDSSTVNAITVPSPLAPRTINFNNASRAYTLSGSDPAVAAITSGALVKNGAGTLTLTGTNTFWSTTIGAGATVTLANDIANSGALGTGPILLNGGTLAMYDNTSGFNSSTFNLQVPAGQIGTVLADSRCDIYGSLTGGGTLNFRVPWIRTTLFSDWSAFTGVINVTTDADGGDLRMGTNYFFPGFPNATVTLADRVWAYYTGILAEGAGTTIEIGELSGGPLSVLMGGPTGGRNFTYRIGGKTAAASEVTFAGNIQEQNTSTTTSFIKTGAGTWKLSGTCAWNGGTIVEQGTLKISGSVTCGAATNVASGATIAFVGGTLATDAVNVAAGGSLSGNGAIQGDLNNSGTVTCGTGALSISGDVVNDGTMRFTGGAALSVTGAIVNNGTLDLLTGAPGLPANLQNNGLVIDSTAVKVNSCSKSGTTVTVTVASYAGHSYKLQRANALTANTAWQDVGGVQAGVTQPDGTPTVLTFTDGNAAGASWFYRVQIAP